mmetsp:Transcript_107914/g.302234  ORF Transcript_107914/g.302234 Transcript_107914/m.302234 type:complete len:261 (+) Transcript_107914:391-1173(+)
MGKAQNSWASSEEGDEGTAAKLCFGDSPRPPSTRRFMHRFSTLFMRFPKAVWQSRILCRKQAKSNEFTDAPGLSRRMHSSSSSKLNVEHLSSEVAANSNSTYMSKCLSLTSSSCSARIALLLSFILSSSALEMCPLPSWSMESNSFLIESLTAVSAEFDFSASAVLPTTSTRMPVSMLSIVKEFTNTYSRKQKSIKPFPVPRIASQAAVTSSRMVPMTTRDNMLFPMEPKNSSMAMPCSCTSASVLEPWWNSEVRTMDQL